MPLACRFGRFSLSHLACCSLALSPLFLSVMPFASLSCKYTAALQISRFGDSVMVKNCKRSNPKLLRARS